MTSSISVNSFFTSYDSQFSAFLRLSGTGVQIPKFYPRENINIPGYYLIDNVDCHVLDAISRYQRLSGPEFDFSLAGPLLRALKSVRRIVVS